MLWVCAHLAAYEDTLSAFGTKKGG